MELKIQEVEGNESEDYSIKMVVVGDSGVGKSNILNGQERYKSITAAYYKGAKGAMIVYDITKQETYRSVDKWYKEIKEYGDKSLIPMLVGNKCDLKHLRTVETKEALERAKTLSMPFMETSAAESTNVDLAFKQLITGKI